MSDDRVALIALLALAGWLLIGLPMIYLPEHSEFFKEPLGIKPGEWLLSFATLGLWYATWRLVKGADQNAEKQLRAYVHVCDAQILHENDEWSPNIRVTIKNFGQTPARLVKHGIGHNITFVGPGDFTLKEDQFVSDLGPGQHTTKTMIVAREMWHKLFKPMMKAGTGYIFGEITYRDALSDKVRKTVYRFEIKFDDAGQAGIFFSSEGNYSD
ncbi:hypothetical protein [Bradyrhizobium diazoefficiens]|uniref:hypothetical protein n=1 Tax=Bradyrhizobium diazoefficiens TaxID=1355477 RepID=UPI002714FC9A|nr:hypothetical protein [Bradyrhizobium diazoefficiens]WLA53189.1 hypothetical protein QIH81_21620 [Bradyrhizobium diazoefficiens]